MEIGSIKYINIFNIAITNIFESIFNIKVHRKGISVIGDNKKLKDLTSIMILKGDLYGFSLISFSKKALTRLYLNLFGNNNIDDMLLVDLSNEILNMVMGNAKNLIIKNYNKKLVLSSPKQFGGNISKETLISELFIYNSETMILGAYLKESGI
ncbi:MAG: chemotaxis protein CheX [Deferribacterota bacterium]|nr:chemotaxis protein CheX [Deferribacterota bacterium]